MTRPFSGRDAVLWVVGGLTVLEVLSYVYGVKLCGEPGGVALFGLIIIPAFLWRLILPIGCVLFIVGGFARISSRAGIAAFVLSLALGAILIALLVQPQATSCTPI